MSKKLRIYPLGVLTGLVALSLGIVPAFAHHPTGSASASCEAGYNVSGDYVGGSSTRWLETNVTLTVDGVPENIVSNQGPIVSPGFNIFTRNGVALNQVDVVGTIKMFNNIHTNAVAADTDGPDTFDGDHSSSGSMNAGINFFDSDKQVSVTADSGYAITFVGIDYSGSDSNEVTFANPASPFSYDAPGSETIDNVTVTIFRPATPASDAKGALLDTFTFNFHETLDCYQPCDETVTQDKVYGPVVDVGDPVWGLWVDNGDGTFTRTGTQATTQHWTQTTVDAQDPQHVCGVDEGDDPGEREVKETREGDSRFWGDADCDAGYRYQDVFDPDGVYLRTDLVETHAWELPFVLEDWEFEGDIEVQEPEDCQVAHDTLPWSESKCDVYSYGYTLDGVNVQTGSGSWQDLFAPESVNVEVVVPANEGEDYPNGTVFNFVVSKSLDCLECKITPLYPQASYLDPNAPDGYWQGPFDKGPGVAVIIHPDGQTPSADRVTVLSSLCPEVYPGGYIYDPDGKFLDGWVYQIECYGEETRYTYFGYDWGEWVQLGKYDSEGNRYCPREEGCADWIKEKAGILP